MSMIRPLGILVLLLHGMAWAAETAPAQVSFNIVPQSMQAALNEFAHQSGYQLLFQSSVARDAVAPRVVGLYSPEAALKQLLANTGLSYRFVNERTITIRSAALATGENESAPVRMQQTTRAGEPAAAGSLLLAQAEAMRPVDEKKDERQEKKEEEKPTQELLVTGSRIQNDASRTAGQVISFDRADIEASGEPTLERFLRQLPQNINGASEIGAGGSRSEFGSSGAFNISGASSVNLRGFGSEATLVLVNGHRIGKGGILGDASDISGIPLSSIERIDILMDGASSIYGSDAVGGVVNIILRDDYEGIESTLRYGRPEQGGFGEYTVDMAGGLHWEGGRLGMNVELFRSTRLDGSERPLDFQVWSTSISGASPANLIGPTEFTDTGIDLLPLYYLDSAGHPVSVADAQGMTGLTPVTKVQVPAGQDGTALGLGDFVPNMPANERSVAGNNLLPLQNRYTVGLTFGQELGASLRASANVHYSKTKTESTNGIVDHSSIYTAFGDGIAADNPFNPFGVDVGWFERFPELGLSGYDTDSSQLRVSASLEGRLPAKWEWNISGGYNRAVIDSLRLNQLNHALLESYVSDGFETPGGGVEFFNPFAPFSSHSQELIDSLRLPPQPVGSATWETMFEGVVRGPLFKLGSSEVRAAVGASWRNEQLFSFDETGFIAFGDHSPVGSGGYRAHNARAVTSGFAEVAVPLVSNAKPGLRQLDLTGSSRYDSYEGIGGASTWSAGAVWSPMSRFRVRANYSTSFLAPTLSQSLLGSIVDPQYFLVLYGPDFDFIGFTDATLISGGNSNLRPETADSVSLGVEFSPAAIPGLTLDLTGHSTDYKNRIAYNSALQTFQPGITDVLYPDQAYLDEDDRWVIDNRAINIAAIKNSGIDATVKYALATRAGDFMVQGNYGRTLKNDVFDGSGGPGVSTVKRAVNSPLAFANVISKHRADVSVSWRYLGLTTAVDTTYVSETIIEQGFGNTWIFIPPTLVDLTVSYDTGASGRFAQSHWLSGTTATLGIANLTNDSIRVVYPGVVAELNSFLTDPRGRMYTLSLRKVFR